MIARNFQNFCETKKYVLQMYEAYNLLIECYVYKFSLNVKKKKKQSNLIVREKYSIQLIVPFNFILIFCH